MPKIRSPIRRAQIIAPFGIGSLTTDRFGTTLIVAGADHWYEPEERDRDFKPNPWEYRVSDWRLLQRLRVDEGIDVTHFRLPPDYRTPRRNAGYKPNCNLTVPCLRFPQWHFCPFCRTMRPVPPVEEKPTCREPDCPKRKLPGQREPVGMDLVQMRFVALCLHGHAQDVPWTDWVHGRDNAECSHKMKFREAGGDLADLSVVCGCGSRKSLQGITQSDFSLGKGEEDTRQKYMCRGARPWLKQQSSTCANPLRVTLINSLNVHFAQTTTSIFLPRSRRDNPQQPSDQVPAELVKVLEDPPVSFFFTIAGDLASPEVLRAWVKGEVRKLQERPGSDAELELTTFEAIKQQLDGAEDHQITRAISVARGTQVAQPEEAGSDFGTPTDETGEAKYRRMEYNVFRGGLSEPDLRVREDDRPYEKRLQRFFSRVRLVERLRETRVYTGFTRLQEENDMTAAQRAALLRRVAPVEPRDKWLPAYVVYGEGIFLEFNPAAIIEWIQTSQPVLSARLGRLKTRYDALRDRRKVRSNPLSLDSQDSSGARFLLVHTFSHLLINRLVFECGYSTASLRERLYVSDDAQYPMAGLLIYTAAGDSEGTMGGLVRMGRAGRLEPVIYKALEEASWCSGDPVCMELGDHGGQGPDSCNLAACHSCALLPETACEHFNRFLDRGVIVGTRSNAELGFFGEIIRSR